MPTVLRVGPYRFFFCSNKGEEPAHIHVMAASNEAKYCLEPIALAVNYGFNARELTEVEELVNQHCDEFLEAWNDYFG